MSKYIFLISLVILTACNNNSSENNNPSNDTKTVSTNNIPPPPEISVNIVNIYPHDTSAFTQGLQVYNGKLYEGTGDYQFSSLRIDDIKTGKVEKKHLMGTPEIFGEGITIFKDKLYQLTWQSHVVYVYDINNIDIPIKTFSWPYEGWGITNNGTDLIVSDGTANIYFVNADDFKIKHTIQVNDNLGPVDQLNELEYINGYIYANVWQTDYIVKIDPANGHVVGKLDLPGLLEKYDPNDIVQGRTDVLNGIAWDSTTKKMYITGKRWPKMFEVTFN